MNLNLDDKITLDMVRIQCDLAQNDLINGDVLRARERLAVVVIGLDRVCYAAE